MRGKSGPSCRTGIYITAIILTAAVTLYFFLVPLLRKKTTFRARLSELNGEVAVEQKLHKRQREEQRLLEEQDPTYLEKYARDNFGWAREGETVYKLEKTK